MSFPGEDHSAKNELDPWRVILSHLFEIDSYEIPGIIDAVGLTVDWRLTQREDYSHKYRKAAYRPRINSAYEALNDDDKLRVSFIVCDQLSRRGLAGNLDEDLQRIGWRIDTGVLVPATEAVRELFFPQGTQHDAYVRIREIVRRAKHAIRIVDPYVDETVFTILGDVQGPLIVQLLGAKFPGDFALEAAKFQQQHRQVQIDTRKSRDFHDRFIVIDEKECWHLGCSIKDAGNKAFMLSAIEDPRNTQSLLDTLKSSWASATLLD